MLQLRIVSPEKVEYDGEVLSVVVPGTMGQFEILNDHHLYASERSCGVYDSGWEGQP